MELLDVLTYLVWLLASVTFILALKFLASPQTARRGNQLGAAGMALVVLWTFFTTDGMLANWWIVIVGALIGSVAGVLGARRVPMTAMPQMVAIFNGAGGGAAAVVAAAEFLRDATPGETLFGLYVGTPLIERSDYGLTLPDRIVIYQGPLERHFHPRDIPHEVAKTVLHELGHHFGIEDDRLESLGMG